MKKVKLLFKGHENSKLSMARTMLWIMFVYMMVMDWRIPDRDIYGWEWIFTALLAYVLTGKFGFDIIGKRPVLHEDKPSDEEGDKGKERDDADEEEVEFPPKRHRKE